MRMVWRGTISFGLVTIPVRLYVATESKNVPAHQIHMTDGGRVQYKRVCSIDGAEVPYEEIGRGYESTTGELVVLSDDDLSMLPATTSRSIEVISFLPAQSVDPIYLDRSYYVEPERQGAKPYRLLRDALRKKGRVAVAKVTLRDRQMSWSSRPCCGRTRSGSHSSRSRRMRMSGRPPPKSSPWQRHWSTPCLMSSWIQAGTATYIERR
jgi:DNA end-binding protein Ku